jgi:hypothetical protein
MKPITPEYALPRLKKRVEYAQWRCLHVEFHATQYACGD